MQQSRHQATDANFWEVAVAVRCWGAFEFHRVRPGLITNITETGIDNWSASTDFTYDNRKRLIEEERSG